MPRIAFINTVCTGSHGRIMDDLRRAAEGAGFTCRIIFSRGKSAGAHCVRFGDRADVALHGAASRLFDAQSLCSRRATRRLLRMLDEFSPDLVHLHNAHGYYLNAPMLFAWLKKRNVPLVWTLHDCWALTGHCSHFVRANCALWKTGCHDCPLKKEYPASLLFDRSRQNWQWKKRAFTSLERLTVVTPSQWLGEVAGESFLRGAARRVIGNGVDLKLFTPGGDTEKTRREMGIPPGKKLLLSVAAPFDARKGFADALQIADMLREKAVLVMVGLTREQVESLPRGVIGVERTEGPEALVALYRAADCLLNPTYEDTYPTVNMEALACGTPAAAYGVCGCPEQLEAPCGETVPVGNARALAEAALALCAEKPKISAACRAKAERDFDREKAVKAYTKLYEEVLHEKGKLD